MLILKVTKTQAEEQTFEFQYGTYVIGRSSKADVFIDDKRVSRKHARIEYSEMGVHIYDLDSANGLYVNGIKIKDIELYNTDVVSIKTVKINIESEFEKPEDKHILDDTGSEKFITNEFTKSKNTISSKESSWSLDSDINQKNSSSEENLLQDFDGMSLPSLEKENSLLSDTAFSQKPKTLHRDLTIPKIDNKKGFEPEFTGIKDNNKFTKSLFSRFAVIIDKIFLTPLFNFIRQLDYKVFILSSMTVLVAFIVMFILYPMKEDMGSYLRNESLTHAESIARFVAIENREAFIAENYDKLNIKVALELENVQKVRIIRRDGKIVAPTNEKYREAKEDYLSIAVEAMRKGQVAGIQPLGGEVFSVVSPIIAFTDDNVVFSLKPLSEVSQNEIIGLAQIEYSTARIFSGEPYSSLTIYSFAKQIMVALLIAFIVALVLIKITVPVFSNLKQDIQRSILGGQVQLKDHLKLREFSELRDVIYEAIKGKKGATVVADMPVMMDDKAEGLTDSDIVEASRCAIQAVEAPIMVVSSEGIIVIANDAFARLMQYGGHESVEGQGISSVITDIDAYDKIQSLLSNPDSIEGTQVIDSIELSGFQTGIQITRSENGHFHAVLFRES